MDDSIVYVGSDILRGRNSQDGTVSALPQQLPVARAVIHPNNL